MGLFSRNKNNDLNNIDDMGIIQDNFQDNLNDSNPSEKNTVMDLREYLMTKANIAEIYTDYVSGNYNSIVVTSLVDEISMKIRNGLIKGESKRFNYQNLSPALYIAYIEVLIQAMTRIEKEAEDVARNKYDKISGDTSAKISELENTISELRDTNVELQSIKNQLQSDNSLLTEDNESYRNSLNDLQNRLVESQNTINSLNDTINGLNEELNRYKSMPSISEKDNEINSLKESVAVLNKAIAELKKRTLESENNKSKLLEDNSALNNKCTVLTNELKKANSNLAKSQDDLKEAADAIEELQNANNELNKQLEDIQNKPKELKDVTTEISDEDIDSRLVEMKDVIANKDIEIAKMADEYSALKRQCISLKRNLASTNDAEKILPQYKKTIANLQNDIDKYVEDILSLTKETTDLKAEIELYKSKSERNSSPSEEVLNVQPKETELLPNGLTLSDVMLCGYWSKKIVTENVKITEVINEVIPNLDSLDHNDLYNSFVDLIGELIVDTSEETEDTQEDTFDPSKMEVFSTQQEDGGEQ